MKHHRIPPESARILSSMSVFSDDELRTIKVPVLLMIGENEVIYDAAKALGRARALIPNFEGELVPGVNHNICGSHYHIVDARLLFTTKLTHQVLKNGLIDPGLFKVAARFKVFVTRKSP